MPRLQQAPAGAVGSAGDDAIEWAESIGGGFYELDEWQRFCIRGILSEDEHARLCAEAALLIVPRQNGKGTILEIVELYALFVLDLPLILHTAHLSETSADHMARLWAAIRSDPELERQCKHNRVSDDGFKIHVIILNVILTSFVPMIREKLLKLDFEVESDLIEASAAFAAGGCRDVTGDQNAFVNGLESEVEFNQLARWDVHQALSQLGRCGNIA